MKAKYCHKGEAIDFKNETEVKIEAGDVLTMGGRIGVAGTDIEPRALGSVHVSGVYEITKKDKAALAVGTVVYLSADGITTTKTDNTPAGYVAAASSAESVSVWVKINA